MIQFRQKSAFFTSINSLLIVLFLTFCQNAAAQYFGRNKVNYETHKFKIMKSPHFEVYNYMDNEDFMQHFILQSEQWYKMHQDIFKDTFKYPNPIILYNNHADFQQTNTVGGIIGVGTGGVTEGLKNRVILPVMASYAQTDHVLGHELVHAFQYRLAKGSDSLSMGSLGNIPLWMVEGLAEYMSIGYIDPHTAIWIRSALLNDRLPTIKDITNKPGEYFPYRWGQAFWAYVTARYEDTIIKPLFISTAMRGYRESFEEVLDMDREEFSKDWKQTLTDFYLPYQQNHALAAAGKKLIGKENAGEMNIVPALSPDGKWLAFWTEKNLFSIDLYLANAHTGEVGERITTSKVNSHIDEYSSFESAITWSPDSRRFAFVSFTEGHNQLMIADIDGTIENKIEIPELMAFSNPAWSPDGEYIVLMGSVNGTHDLYAYHLDDKRLEQLTNSPYSEMQPDFSPDGRWIVFVTDELSFRNERFPHTFTHNIAVLNLDTRNQVILPVFQEANNMNPVFSEDGSSIYFLSDRDGFRNLYQYSLADETVYQNTNFYTGITGITMNSPAISISRESGQLAYSYYNNQLYTIYTVATSALAHIPVAVDRVDKSAANIAGRSRSAPVIVQRNLVRSPNYGLTTDSLSKEPYRAKLQLGYVGGGAGIGISNQRYSTGAAGSVVFGFSDMLSNYRLMAGLSLNGEIYDFGGEAMFINQKKQMDWGLGISHTPYLSGVQYAFYDSLVIDADTVQVVNLTTDLQRTYVEQAQIFGSYPFSQTRRLEAGASYSRYHYRIDRYSDYYYQGFLIGRDKEKIPAPEGFNIGHAYTAYVEDNSFFGIASPLLGHRMRLSIGSYFGELNLRNALVDYRKYFRFAPFTLATRNMYMGRFGPDVGTDRIPPLYLGYPTLIRGYRTLDATSSDENQIRLYDLTGSQMYVGNIELRLPFTGPERLAVIRSRFILTQLSLFTDAGIAWAKTNADANSHVQEFEKAKSRFIFSSGISLRVNLFGALIIEPYYAIPWQNGGFDNPTFGLNFQPGW